MNGKLSVEERLGIFDNLKGKTYSQGNIISTEIIDIEGETRNLEFDISRCILSVDDINFELELPSAATLTEIKFDEDKIILTGKVSFFSGSGKTDYSSFIHFVDNALKDGKAYLNTNSGVAKLTKIELI